MSIVVHHHPEEGLLWDYYRGALAPGLSLTVSIHASSCSECRTDLRLFDAIGSALMDEVEGVAMSENALDLALARIERPEETPMAATIKHPAFLEGFELPESLKSVAIKDRYWAAPGVWMAPIALDGDPKAAKTFLMFVKAGMAMPEHTHRGREATVVLKGHFSDHNGEYRVGDMSVNDDTVSHSPVIAADEDCLCLVAQENAIVPKTLLGRLLQPLARI